MLIEEEVAGRKVEIETFDDWVSPMDARGILSGSTYWVPDELTDVRLVLDVGGNVGATSIYFACRFPDAEIHAFEPAEATFRLLARNTAPFPRIHPHHFGLLDEDGEADLYSGAVGPGQASIHRRDDSGDDSERVRLRSAAAWATEQGIDHIDVLKIDTEGCEVAVLESLRESLAGVRVVFLEFHSREDRSRIDDLLSPTHDLAVAQQLYETGDLLYVRADEAEKLRPGFVRRVLLGAQAEPS